MLQYGIIGVKMYKHESNGLFMKRKKWEKEGRYFEFEASSDSMGIEGNGTGSQVVPNQRGVEY